MRRLSILIVLSLSLGYAWPLAAAPIASDRTHAIPESERVDVNHASLNDLLKLPGITRVWAERIVRFRPYRTKLDLVQQGILPPAVYNRIKDAVVVHREKK